MVKYVFGTHDNLAHVFASGEVDRGRSADSRMLFENNRLYSYGRHFVLAVRLGDREALLNADSYSVSTTQHQGIARNALNHYRTWTVPGLTRLAELLDRVDSLEGLTGRNPEYAKDLEAARGRVLEFVRAHALHLEGRADSGRWNPDLRREGSDYVGGYESTGTPAAVRVLQAAGIKRPAVAWAKALREAKAQAARDAKNEAADALKAVRREARYYGGLSGGHGFEPLTPAGFKAIIAQALADRYGADYRLKGLSRTLRAARSAALAWKGFPQSGIQALRDRIKIVDRTRNNLARLQAEADRRLRVRDAIKGLRHNLRGLALEVEKVPAGVDRVQVPEVQDRAAQVARYVDALRLRDSGRYCRPSRTWAALADLAKDLRPYVDAQAARHKAEAEAREAARLERERADRESWIAGVPGVRFYGRDAQGGAYLRAIGVERAEDGTITGGTLQTSQGAEVPLTHALRAFRFIKAVRASGTPWHRNGRTVRVGFYQVDRIEPSGDFWAGCHRINWAEVARLALALGVADLDPDSSAAEPSATAA